MKLFAKLLLVKYSLNTIGNMGKTSVRKRLKTAYYLIYFVRNTNFL